MSDCIFCGDSVEMEEGGTMGTSIGKRGICDSCLLKLRDVLKKNWD